LILDGVAQGDRHVKELLLPVNNAAANLGLGRTKIYELIADGDLKLVKIGKKSLITVASIEALIARLSERADADR
jgi:excisionase family DNA binding protein